MVTDHRTFNVEWRTWPLERKPAVEWSSLFLLTHVDGLHEILGCCRKMAAVTRMLWGSLAKSPRTAKLCRVKISILKGLSRRQSESVCSEVRFMATPKLLLSYRSKGWNLIFFCPVHCIDFRLSSYMMRTIPSRPSGEGKVSLKVATVPCSLVKSDRRFECAYWLHHEEDNSRPLMLSIACVGIVCYLCIR